MSTAGVAPSVSRIVSGALNPSGGPMDSEGLSAQKASDGQLVTLSGG